MQPKDFYTLKSLLSRNLLYKSPYMSKFFHPKSSQISSRSQISCNTIVYVKNHNFFSLPSLNTFQRINCCSNLTSKIIVMFIYTRQTSKIQLCFHCLQPKYFLYQRFSFLWPTSFHYAKRRLDTGIEINTMSLNFLSLFE